MQTELMHGRIFPQHMRTLQLNAIKCPFFFYRLQFFRESKGPKWNYKLKVKTVQRLAEVQMDGQKCLFVCVRLCVCVCVCVFVVGCG